MFFLFSGQHEACGRLHPGSPYLKLLVRLGDRGQVLKRFSVEHVNTFLEVKGQNLPEMEDPNWIELCFMMNVITSYFNKQKPPGEE